jgi:hypothetical protein
MKGGSRLGAGRPAQHIKAEHCRQIDVRRLAKAQILAGGTWGWKWRNPDTGKELASIGITAWPGALVLEYKYGHDPIKDRIDITTSACHLGGTRPWFHCPRCGGRVALLYLRGGRFRCRKCHGLRYASQSEDECGRSWRKQSKLEARLGPNWRKPKGMHKATRTKLLEAIWQCEEVREDALAAFMDRIGFKGW